MHSMFVFITGTLSAKRLVLGEPSLFKVWDVATGREITNVLGIEVNALQGYGGVILRLWHNELQLGDNVIDPSERVFRIEVMSLQINT